MLTPNVVRFHARRHLFHRWQMWRSREVPRIAHLGCTQIAAGQFSLGRYNCRHYGTRNYRRSAAKPVKDFLLDFSRYKNLMKSIEKLKAQITRLFRRMFTKGGPPEQTILTISGSSIIDPAVLPPSRVPVRQVGMCNVNGWLIAYLIISHAALLVVLLWLVARHLN